MISIEEVRVAHAFLVRRFDLADPLDEPAVAAALREADELALGRAEDEPAAVLVALTRRPRRLGDAWLRLPLVIARNLARTQGAELSLDVGDVELENLRLRVAARSVTFEEVRAWVAARMVRGSSHEE